jgi:hypothetical protein
MHLINKKNNSYVIAASVATLFTFAIMAAVSNMATTSPAAATTTTTSNATTTSSSGIELSPEPVYQERQIRESRTAINQTHFQVAISGNGTLTLPNTTETISTTSTGSVLSALDGTATGKEVITTEDGSESATATTYGIARLEERRGIMIALFDTNSTGILAPLDGMILAGQLEYPPEETHSIITLREWQSGIPLPTGTTTTPEEPPLMNTTTTTTTNATTTADTNATTAAPEEEGEGNEEGEDPNEFEDCIVPPGRDPGDVGC